MTTNQKTHKAMKTNISTPQLTLKGNTPVDIANSIWYNQLTPTQRAVLSAMFSNYKSIAYRHRACINYIADNLDIYAN